MSDYHILTQDENRKFVQAVFHIPIPSTGTNQANLSWRAAIVLWQRGSENIVSILTDIDFQEDVNLKSGALYEKCMCVKFSKINLNRDEREVEIKAAFDKEKTALIAEKQKTLEWIGFEGDV